MLTSTPAQGLFRIFNYLFIAVLALLCLAPFIHVLAISFSSNYYVLAGEITFWPKGWNVKSYTRTFEDPLFMKAMLTGVNRTLLGTAISMFVTVTSAYALSRDNLQFRERGMYVVYFLIPMLFTGGLIPWYLLVKSLHLTNTIWSLVLPQAVVVFNVVLMMNFFRSLPRELEEASFIDGAGHFRTFVLVYLPLSLPSIATLSLFTMVTHWNAWFDGLIFMNHPDQYPLSTYLRVMLQKLDFTNLVVSEDELKYVSERTSKAAQIFISVIPILLVYPFLQKYFVKGMTLGAVKE